VLNYIELYLNCIEFIISPIFYIFLFMNQPTRLIVTYQL